VAALLASLPLSEVTAGELKLAYQAVMQAGKSDAAPVLDDKKHLIGIAAFRGIAIFAGEQLALHRYDGWFDLGEGGGSFGGHAAWNFDDGSTLRAQYEGRAEAEAGDRAAVSARLFGFSGTGRFEQVSGEGSFAGQRFEKISKGGVTYLKGSLVLKVAD
jgi:hypothetical protein